MPIMDTCANCSAVLSGPYCAACGEKRLSRDDFAVGHFARHVLHDLTHFDAKIFRSLLWLFTKPGFLTAEFSAGRWRRYIKPTTLFILINLFFFFAKGGIMNWGANTYIHAAGSRATVLVNQKAAERGLTEEEYLREFNRAAREAQHSMFFFAIPIVGLVSFAMFRRRYYVEHLVYSIHFHAFLLVFLTIGLKLLFRGVLVPIAWIGLTQPVEYLAREPGLNYLVFAGAGAYHALALHRAFSIRALTAITAAVVLVIAEAAFLVLVFQRLVFYWVYYTA